MTETLGFYSAQFGTFVHVFEKLVDQLPELEEPDFDPETLAGILKDDDSRTAFRYLAAPPISEDDLKTLSESTLAVSTLRQDHQQARRVRDIVFRIIDPHRFPWIVDHRSPSHLEKAQAIIASAVLVSARKIETARRGIAKQLQESAVKEFLLGADLHEVDVRDMNLLSAAPSPGEFCGESNLGGTRADIVVRLYDGRLMPIECKVSNSAVNSYKRVNHEAAGKARGWITAFGQRQIVPAAVIAGVFNPGNLIGA